jgi:hypothetical protein
MQLLQQETSGKNEMDELKGEQSRLNSSSRKIKANLQAGRDGN